MKGSVPLFGIARIFEFRSFPERESFCVQSTAAEYFLLQDPLLPVSHSPLHVPPCMYLGPWFRCFGAEGLQAVRYCTCIKEARDLWGLRQGRFLFPFAICERNSLRRAGPGSTWRAIVSLLATDQSSSAQTEEK